MAKRVLEQRVQEIERRVANVERLLPTLATKVDLAAGLLRLPTKAELLAAVAPIAANAAPQATNADTTSVVREETMRMRLHMDMVFAGLRAEVRVIADWLQPRQHDEPRSESVRALLAPRHPPLTSVEPSVSKRS